ncbi:hypothetical protein OROGR_007745 [Orobanche gracilis]
MEEMKSAFIDHMGQVADLVEKLSAELRSGLKPACDNFVGFFHAIDWKWRTLVDMSHFVPCVVAGSSFLLKEEHQLPDVSVPCCTVNVGGVYLAERLNQFLVRNWRSFAGQNYFDPNGLFLSVLWSGPLLVIAIVILVNTLFSLCYLIVRWKRADLRHRARLARSKED